LNLTALRVLPPVPTPFFFDLTSASDAAPSGDDQAVASVDASAAPGSRSLMGFLRHRVGESIKGRYEVLEALGGGSFGTVYRVRDNAVGVDLACKEMHVLDDPTTARAERALALEWFKREALNLATVRHPHIPSAYFEQEDGAWNVCPRCGLPFPAAEFCPDHGAKLLLVESRFYLMMDFIDGPTLEEVAVNRMKSAGRPLEEEAALEWIAQIAQALRALHRVGIVHRDIKPENIKVRSQDNAAVLLDFGLTRKAEEAGGYGTARISGTTHMGTPGYAPPDPRELSRPEARSDIYALGMTLLRLLSGRDPQDASQLAELKGRPPRAFNANISPALEAIIVRATQVDRDKRYAQIDDLLDELHDIHAPAGRSKLAPFIFAGGARARTPLELARLVESLPDESANYLGNGLFEQWLLAGGYAGAAQAAKNAKERFSSQPRRALEVFRRALLPLGSSGLSFDAPRPVLRIEPPEVGVSLDSGEAISLRIRLRLDESSGGYAFGTLDTLLLETPSDAGLSASTWSDATSLPGLAHPREWEVEGGEGNAITLSFDSSRLPNGRYAGSLIVRDGVDGELLARVPVRYEVRPLHLRLEPALLDFGPLAVGSRSSRRVRVLKATREDGVTSNGTPRGSLYIVAGAGPIVAPPRFEGEGEWEVEIDAARPEAVAKGYDVAVHIDTNGGRLRLPVRYEIVLPPARVLALVGSRVAVSAGALAVARLAYAVVNPAFTWRWLSENGTIAPPQIAGYGAPIVLGAFVGLVLEAARHSREADAPAAAPGPSASTSTGARPSKAGLKLSPVAHSMLLASTLGAVLGWPLLWAAHWVLWGAGDWLLRPLGPLWEPVARSLSLEPSQAAPIAWLLLGAAGGALWGAERVLAATGRVWSRYGIGALASALAFIALINAMLFTG
jgi:serine/threonine protein kinase